MSREAKRFWENYGPAYQHDCQIPIDIHYGPGSPNEAELQLIGPVAGKRVLEIGCGGAQRSIAFALQGAIVTAVDIAVSQLEFARTLAETYGVAVTFHQRSMEDLTPIGSESQDIVFSAFAIGYVYDLLACFKEVYRVLKPEGVFVWSQGHPFFLLNAETKQPGRSYFDTGWKVYGEGEAEIPFAVHQHTVSDYINTMREAGFTLERMVEPDSRRRYPYDPWFGRWDYVPDLLDLVPATVIFKASKK